MIQRDKKYRRSLLLLSVLLLLTQAMYSADFLPLNKAVIVVDPDEKQLSASADFLQEEIRRRTGIDLSIVDAAPRDGSCCIYLSMDPELPVPTGMIVPSRGESFAIWVDDLPSMSPTLHLRGRDGRGVLFAAGHLLRVLYLAEDHISIARDLRITSAPADRLRAHQVISNTQCKDGFMDWNSADDLEQHVNDLIIAGANGFEPTRPELLDEYLEKLGIDLFVKLKCQEIIDLDTLSDEAVSSYFSDISGIDHITTYGGDASGAVRPDLFFPHMERVLPMILHAHPGVKWWYSNQCLTDHAKDYDEYIFSYIKENNPPWLYGMVYGPWTKRGIRDVRADLPFQYELRHFPEICHPRWCQYPVPEWDRVFAIVWPRNRSIYAMPGMMKNIYLATRENTIGALPYNHTGTYNDLNKFVWTYAGWKPEAGLPEILEAYARAFFTHDFVKSPYGDRSQGSSREEVIDEAVSYVTEALLLLEENWSGPLISNHSAEKALEHWLTIAECIGGPGVNWRVELFLTRARIDAQIKRKYDLEMKLEREAYHLMQNAGEDDVPGIIRKVTEVLSRIDKEFQDKDAFLREMRKTGLSEKFGDLEEITDNIYSSFNDRYWILDMLKDCRTREDLMRIVDYEDPGDGGFYDNLGVSGEQTHLLGQHLWKRDPGFVSSPIKWVNNDRDSRQRHSRLTHALARYDHPLEMSWCKLDPEASYSFRVVYNGPWSIRIRCQTDEGLLIHDFIEKPGSEVLSFPVPPAATSDGELTLQWTQDISDIMRGVSVSEIWLVREDPLLPESEMNVQ